MMHASQGADRNKFLAALGPAEFAWMLPHLTSYELWPGRALHRCGDEIAEVIFPHSGLVALTPSREKNGALVLVVGHDGMVGALAANASAAATCDADVLISGEASRISADIFRRALDEQTGICRVAARFHSAALAQVQQTAACNARHPVEARICRWLLEVHDRSHSDKVPLTQNEIAQMLGVRRTTVTLVAGRLEAAGALKCRRGFLQIQSREILERHACECYGQPRNETKKPAPISCHEDAAQTSHIAAGQ